MYPLHPSLERDLDVPLSLSRSRSVVGDNDAGQRRWRMTSLSVPEIRCSPIVISFPSSSTALYWSCERRHLLPPREEVEGEERLRDGNLNIAMNFLIRAAHPVVPEVSNVAEPENHEGSSTPAPTSKNQGNHTDVLEDDGWITIPYKELPDNWIDAANIQQLRSLDRSFIFPGEHMHILVCLSAWKQESEIITPFRVAAAMSRNENNSDTLSAASDLSPKDDISATESLLRMESHKQQTEIILESFKNSNFFIRIIESDEQLWSRRNDPSAMNSEVLGRRSHPNNGSKKVPRSNVVGAVVDKGSFDGNTSGGVARDTVKCYSLSNGDIVVLLEVNVGVSNLKDPVLEVIQFEKYQSSNPAFEDHNNLLVPNIEDPCRELLNWLIPLDRTLPSSRPLSPPLTSSVSQKSTYPASGSQIFSFGHFRSYSMPSFPQVTGPPASITSFSSSKPAFDLEDFDRLSQEKLMKNQDTRNEGLLSFRGVALEPQRFSAHCGLEGIYLPGRRWQRKLEIIQPVEIHSFATECNTEDLLCVQIKNVSPAHIPDIIIFLDAIAIISEEASKCGPPLLLPIASIETGNGHSLPDLPLRRGEEHSFILKLATTATKEHKGNNEAIPYTRTGAAASKTHRMSSISEGVTVFSPVNQFAILVNCRCNYTESKLFFKHITDWQPRIARDLMISITSESHHQISSPNVRAPQLPVKVLTLKATNLTSEDLTFTVLAPETSTSSVLSLSSTPKTPMNSYAAFHDYVPRIRDKSESIVQSPSSVHIASKSQNESQQTAITSDVISRNSSGLTHLWLQSAVPLGCIPARSSATVKLELLPLTDGIITLDTLQIAVKEKGLTFIPEHSLMIHATSSIATGIS
ncbi:hypothetical protein OPV22_004966 [Ensete ventricosum]|uniref:Peroxisome biogenesis factor 1 N-terminal psi beta-barrel fold domain-containing protein n=1 Tax=Ensete ventricosum TaxID=4639 RepID=A0AAV8RN26_ENSVE|nr:hypothetical protein OPV22_004966 [Ensete ventricosum]